MRDFKIERDALVVATDGEVGRVSHVVVDPDTREVTDMVVDRGGREIVIPVTAIASARGDRIVLRGPRTGLAADTFERDQFRPVDDEEARGESQRQAVRGGTPLLDADDAAVVVGGEAAPPAPPRQARGEPASRPADELRVPVAMERLEVEKRPVELGAIEVRKTVLTEEQSVPVELMREELHVEVIRVPDRPPTSPVADLFREGTIRVPVRGEEAFVRKQAYVTDEVIVDKEQLAERQTIADTVRRERVTVEEHEVRDTGVRPDPSVRREAPDRARPEARRPRADL